MSKYLSHLKSLYVRPTLNGIDGTITHRAASPFELFLDLIFVVALARTAYLYELFTLTGFLAGTLFFIIIYSIWFTLTTYTVMFMKEEVNYWVRAMIFIIMLPMVFLLSIKGLNTRIDIFIFCTSIAASKFFLSRIFRDSILNAPLNHVAVSNVYTLISRRQAISALILFIAGFSPNQTILLILFAIVAINELILLPAKQHKVIVRQPFPMPVDYELLMERHLLFILLIFGEALVSIVSSIDFNSGTITIINAILIFASMFLFYVRIQEETEFNNYFINNSLSMPYMGTAKYFMLLLFILLSEVPHQIEHHSHPLPITVIFIFGIMIYIGTSHLHLNIVSLKNLEDPFDRIFHKMDIKTIILMYITASMLLIFHHTTFQIYLITFTFFLLHTVALPFRKQLINKKCELGHELEEEKKCCKATITN